MSGMTDYDRDVRMFRETPKPIDVARLRFLRWLAEQGRLEHLPAGPSCGELVVLSAMEPCASSTHGHAFG
jgi:hypothetical protein